jgi:hypothetical protein
MSFGTTSINFFKIKQHGHKSFLSYGDDSEGTLYLYELPDNLYKIHDKEQHLV